MPKFQVWSGTVKVTILAEDPHAAAVELLESRPVHATESDGAYNDNGMVGEQIIVRQPGDRRPPERFITLQVLAQLNRETTDAVWRRQRSRFDPSNN